MKEGRTVEVAALRAAIASVDNGEAVGVAGVRAGRPPPADPDVPITGAVSGAGAGDVRRRALSPTDLQRILDGETMGLHEQAADYEAFGRVAEAAALRTQADRIAHHRAALGPGRDVAAGLPYIDAPSVEVTAPPQCCWDACRCRSSVGRWQARRRGSWPQCSVVPTGGHVVHARCPGPLLGGFHVVGAERPRRWWLEGRHRFSVYALEFRIEELGPGRSRLSAESRAAFTGWAGSLYRTLVIGSGGHRVAVRRMLRSVKVRAEADAGIPAGNGTGTLEA